MGIIGIGLPKYLQGDVMVTNAPEISHLPAHLSCIDHTVFTGSLWGILLHSPLPFPREARVLWPEKEMYDWQEGIT